MSEHDPLWAVATLAVDCNLYGVPRVTTQMVFPTSNDVAWSNRPKVELGQQGVFLLQPAPLPLGSKGIPAQVCTYVAYERDVAPLDQRGHLATLVRCGVDG